MQHVKRAVATAASAQQAGGSCAPAS
jgi:hypothetical protein